MYSLIFLVSGFFYSQVVWSQAQIDMEHTLVEPEGSSWGTEDLLRQKLKIDEKEIPEIFKIPRIRPAPVKVNLSETKKDPLYSLFGDDQVLLFKDLNICLDKKIPTSNAGFQEAQELFLSRLVGPSQGPRPMSLKFIPLSLDLMDSNFFSQCDLIVIQPEKVLYPFDRLPLFPPTNLKKMPEIVLGLFYRFTEESIPVIVFNPQIDLVFESKQRSYISVNEKGRYEVDGRILFFHELGHVLGLSHIHESIALRDFSVMSVMGSNQNDEKPENIQTRFGSDLEIWKNWNLQQTSIYRSILWKWTEGVLYRDGQLNFQWPELKNEFCVFPGEDLFLRLKSFSMLNLEYTEQELQTLLGRRVLGGPFLRGDSYQSGYATWVYKLNDLYSLSGLTEASPELSPILQVKEFRMAQEGADYYISLSGAVTVSSLGKTRFGVHLKGPPARSFALGSWYSLDVSKNAATCFGQ